MVPACSRDLVDGDVRAEQLDPIAAFDAGYVGHVDASRSIDTRPISGAKRPRT